MNFNIIDLDVWDRKPYFEYYLTTLKCTYSITCNIDITGLLSEIKKKDIKFYPTFIYVITKAVNSNKEFRMNFDDKDNLGYWDEMNPCYTIFHDDDKTFSNIWSKYSKDFNVFYNYVLKDMDEYKDVKGLSVKEPFPKNVFPISCTPWVTFTGFNLNVYNDGKYLLPVITLGKYFNENGKILLPLALQIHHAVADGYHSAKFINEIQDFVSNYKEWLNL
ncbi:type A chloramphenicol O-acetyltransferase [Clostridium frigidicarnis]|uniref:Chloramphenicol acetyltransferase n=1 Tax=Clostridium frigidicarnis TaxID=84698 RepID=A0A1I1AIE6_9CLOT|nr:type A chloramphenicol O-acetyltransferase [Clostridium frigidicarnis]SFB37262.1 chloramphenicol O-acetyltransferase type A [Clostridium frigidicarnis]